MHIFLVLALLFMPLTTQALTLDFEDLSDSTAVVDQYVQFGISFGHATAVTAGVSLFEPEFPPHSGTTVLFDEGGP